MAWHDVTAYVEWLSEKTRKMYRLASESEWEYAVRAGTRTRRYWGEDPRETGICRHANEAGSETSFEWRNDACGDGYRRTAPVGSFVSNGWGVHDMIGNAGEWVEDCWHKDYSGAPSDGSAWTSGTDCRLRVLRGSGWPTRPGGRRVYRPRGGPDFRRLRRRRLPNCQNAHPLNTAPLHHCGFGETVPRQRSKHYHT